MLKVDVNTIGGLKLKVKIKMTIFTILSLLLIIVGTNYNTSIGAMATIEQLNDSYDSSFGVKFWNDLRNNVVIVYVGLLFLLFLDDIVLFFKKIFAKQQNK